MSLLSFDVTVIKCLATTYSMILSFCERKNVCVPVGVKSRLSQIERRRRLQTQKSPPEDRTGTGRQAHKHDRLSETDSQKKAL